MKERTMEISSLAAIAIMFALGSSNVSASGGCKALDHDACTQSTSCRWIRGYQRSDGSKVAAYCRKLPSSKVKKATPRSSSKQG